MSSRCGVNSTNSSVRVTSSTTARPEAVVEVLVDLPAVVQRQEDAAQAAAVRGEHFLGDAAEREHLALEGDSHFIARPGTGRPVNADTGAATMVTPAEVPSLGASPRRTRRSTSASRCEARSRPCRATGRASRAVPRPGGRQRARRFRDHLLYGRSGTRGPAARTSRWPRGCGSLRHLVGAAETQRRGTAGGLRAVDEPDPRDGLPDADRRSHRHGRAPDSAGRKPKETRPCDRAGRRPRTPPMERPRGRRVRRSARAAARSRRRRRGRQQRRREAGGAAPGGVPPAAGQRAGGRCRHGEDAPAVVGEGAREHPRGDIPRAGGRRGRRAPALQQGPAGGDGIRPSRRRRGAGSDPDRVLDAARAAPGMPQAHGQEPVAADGRGPRTAGRGQRLRVGTLHRVAEQPLAQAGNVRPARARALPVADRGRRQPVEHLLQAWSTRTAGRRSSSR